MLSYSQKTYVPDDIFEAWLETNGYGDGIAFNDSVATASLSTINSLDLSSRGVSDLTGISDFTDVQRIYVEYNSLTSLDLSNNHLLTEIWAQGNDSLSEVILPDSISSNIYFNSLNSYVSGMYWVYLSGCNIDSLVFHPDIHYMYVALQDNPLTSLSLDNIFIQDLNLNNTDLSSLDLRHMQVGMQDINLNYCDSLTNLDLRGGHIINFGSHNFNNNPLLTCISVDNLALANAVLTNVDPWVTFDYNCTGLGLSLIHI